ncbi:hypothetical protein LUZ60_017682 [Juncus effusus]|nr:hypothetical protein LUZ60_017682 [Juncus effusus]
MKRWPRSIVLLILFSLLIFKYLVIENPLAEKSLRKILYKTNTFETLKWTVQIAPDSSQNKANTSNYTIISTQQLLTNLTIPNNVTHTQLDSLHTWKTLVPLISISTTLPQTTHSIKEAIIAWKDLLKQTQINKKPHKTKQCPYSVREMNASKLFSEKANNLNFNMNIPCGMVSGSTLTVIGTPGGLFGNFKIELIGSSLPGEPDPPVVLHYNVRLLGDRVTEDPVIVQNTWNNNDEWGSEVRCPSDKESDNAKEVDGLELCSVNKKDEKRIITSGVKSFFNITERSLHSKKDDGTSINNFPFKQGFLAIAILRIGAEGIHMTVDGKHITSFPYRLNLEPWLVSRVRVSGDIKLLSVIASGLPTSENVGNIIDLEMLKAPQIARNNAVDLFIGVVSTANNFKRRMAVRRTWMQYEDVRSGRVMVRFFVGLHKNRMVNEELWSEASTYGDIQILPFVDYYGLITLKTIAICIYGTDAVSARYIMKTDDDAFVRVDTILASIKQTNITHGLLYGLINTDSGPHRNIESKWYISSEEWTEEKYPPWAHGPGYVVSNDIAKAVYKKHKTGSLKIFKLEDVAMGIWIDKMKKEGLDVKYVKDDKINVEGCNENYVVAHYQEPRGMLCLWEKLQETKRAICCD